MPTITIKHKGMLYKQVQIEQFQSLYEVLSIFAKDHPDIDPAAQVLRHHRLGLVDMKQSFKLTGLEPNAVLEVVEPENKGPSVSVIRVALSLENGSRVELELPSKTTLWDSLVMIGQVHKLNLVQNTVPASDTKDFNPEKAMFQMPVMTLSTSRREFADLKELTGTSYHGLGLSKGSVLVRLKYKATDQTLVQILEQLNKLAEARKQLEAQWAQERAKKAEEDKEKAAQRKLRDQEDEARQKIVDQQRKVARVREDQLRSCLQKLQSQAQGEDLTTAVSTLATICRNLLKPEQDPKHRSLSLTNPAIAKRIGRFSAAVECLKTIGFAEAKDQSSLSLSADNENPPLFSRAASLFSDFVADYQTAQAEQQQRQASQASETSGNNASNNAADSSSAMQTESDSPATNASTPASGNNRSSTSTDGKSTKSDSNSTETKSDGGLRGLQEDADANWDSRSAPVADEDASSPSAMTDEDLRPNLNAEYNISDVRKALTALEAETKERERFLATLKTLLTITENLTKGNEASHRTLNLANPKFKEKIGQFAAALDYLKFLGFELKESDKQLVMKNEDKTRLSRAISILRSVYKEKAPSDDEAAIARLGPVDRRLAVYEVEATLLNKPNLGQPEEIIEESSADSALLMAAMRDENKRNKQLYSEEFIVFKSRKDELKKQNQPKYSRTLVRIQFSDQIVMQAFFSPYEHIGDLFALVDKSLRPDHGPFYFTVPPALKLTVDDKGKTFKELQLVPSVLLMFKWVTESSTNARDCMTTELYNSRRPLTTEGSKVPEALNKPASEPEPVVSTQQRGQASDEPPAKKQKTSGGGQMPKWFKKPGK